MKTFLRIALAMLALCIPLSAQQGPTTQIIPFHENYGPLTSGSQPYCTPDLSNRPYTDYKIIYMFTNGAPSAVTMTISGSTNGRTASTITTSTTTAGDSVDVTGVYTYLCVAATSITGSGVTVSGTITGVTPLGSVTIDPTGLATSANQTNGNQKNQICDAGGDCVTVTGSKLDVNTSISTTGLATSAAQTDGSQLAQPVNAAGVNGFGTAGTPAAPTLSVQGIASGTPLPVAYGNGTSVLPTDVAPVGGNASGTTAQFVNCDHTVIYDTNTNGKTQLVALDSGKITYVCGYAIAQSTTSNVTVSLGSGTGTNCGSTYTAKTPAWNLVGPAAAALQGITFPNAIVPYFKTVVSEELCASTSAGVSLQITVSYTTF